MTTTADVTLDSVFGVVQSLVLELTNLAEEQVTPDTEISSIKFDSMDFVEMQVVVKKKFGVAIDSESFEASKITTLRDLCEHVVELKSSSTVAS